ncbi:carboxyl transferase domain-containing protein [Streptomyces sp. NPDC087425]|uniref:carboxyl transferase domain-containing protein n=1 Tax=Streptomyces sp. NPDC087425 TaxID=3365787 RepID=UPI00380CF00F
MKVLVLGPLGVERSDTTVAYLRGFQATLVTELLAADSMVVSTDRLADALYGEDTPRQPLRAVHAHVSRLRRALRQWEPEGPGVERLLTRAAGYALKVSSLESDAGQFLAELTRARTLTGTDAGAVVEILEPALRLWRGPVLEGTATGPGADRLATRLDAARREAVERLASARIALGQCAQAATELEDVLQENPYDESLARLLSTALSRSGRQLEAQRLEERIHRALNDDFGDGSFAVPGQRAPYVPEQAAGWPGDGGLASTQSAGAGAGAGAGVGGGAGAGDRGVPSARPARPGGWGARAVRPARAGDGVSSTAGPAQSARPGDRAYPSAQPVRSGDQVPPPARPGGRGASSAQPARPGGRGASSAQPARPGDGVSPSAQSARAGDRAYPSAQSARPGGSVSPSAQPVRPGDRGSPSARPVRAGDRLPPSGQPARPGDRVPPPARPARPARRGSASAQSAHPGDRISPSAQPAQPAQPAPPGDEVPPSAQSARPGDRVPSPARPARPARPLRPAHRDQPDQPATRLLELLVDRASPAWLGGPPVPRVPGTSASVPGASVAGIYQVGGSPVAVVRDADVRRPAEVRRALRTLEYARRACLPVALLIGEPGRSPAAGSEASAHQVELLRSLVRLRGAVPRVLVSFDDAAVRAPGTAALGDACVLVRPDPAAGTGEQPTAEIKAGSLAEAAASARDLLDYLTQHWAPAVPPRAAIEHLAADGTPLDMPRVVTGIADSGTWLELMGEIGPSLLTGLARIEGKRVGVIANNPVVGDGALTAQAVAKGTRMVDLCALWKIPLLVLVDTPQLPGTGPLLQAAGSELLRAFLGAEVPLVTVITGRAKGWSRLVMGARESGADAVYAWPRARTDLTDGALNGVAAPRHIDLAEGPLDGVIAPQDTRAVVSTLLGAGLGLGA